ncbi:serine/threonine-protein kinase SBK1-like [Pleurodeles waltl]
MNLNEIDENEEILQEMMALTSQTMPVLDLKHHYRVIKELGSGSYGHVLQVEHRSRGKAMALKLMKKKTTRRSNFLLEYCISLCLSSHPRIIGTFGIAFETEKYFIFVQELASAGDLFSIMEPGIGLPEETVKRCALQLAEALDFMHNKALVHRDVKLDNILLFDKACHYIKLGDFGLTRLEGFPVSPMSGTLPYSSPELCSLEAGETLDLDASLDVWAFGVLLFCISTGFFPWDTALHSDNQYDEFAKWQVNPDKQASPSQWKSFTSEAMVMFHKLLAPNPDKRSPAIEALKYLNATWRASNLNNNSRRLDNSKFLEEKVDNLRYLQVKASTDLRTTADSCSRMISVECSPICPSSGGISMPEESWTESTTSLDDLADETKYITDFLQEDN